jgi:hypothetical protein
MGYRATGIFSDAHAAPERIFIAIDREVSSAVCPTRNLSSRLELSSVRTEFNLVVAFVALRSVQLRSVGKSDVRQMRQPEGRTTMRLIFE